MKKLFVHKYFTHTLLFIILGVVFISWAYSVQGAGNCDHAGDPNDLNNPVCSGTFDTVLTKIADFVITLGIPVLVVMFVVTGFMFVAAQGNEKKLADVKRMFMGVVIGTAVIMAAKIIAEIVKNFGQSL